MTVLLHVIFAVYGMGWSMTGMTYLIYGHKNKYENGKKYNICIYFENVCPCNRHKLICHFPNKLLINFLTLLVLLLLKYCFGSKYISMDVSFKPYANYWKKHIHLKYGCFKKNHIECFYIHVYTPSNNGIYSSKHLFCYVK